MPCFQISRSSHDPMYLAAQVNPVRRLCCPGRPALNKQWLNAEHLRDNIATEGEYG